MTGPRRRDGGFTVMELMVATAVLVVMMVLAWGTTRGAMRTKRRAEAVQERQREVRTAMTRLARDFGMAYLSGNEDRGLLDPRTFFTGESSGEFDSVQFTAFVHTPLFADANESDQTAIAYYVAPDREHRDQMNLLRRETHRLGNEKLTALPGEADVVFTRIRRFRLKYWNVQNQEWATTWSTQNTDGMVPRVPDRVQFAITYLDDAEKEVTIVSQARIHLQEMLTFYAN